jgi:membrane protease YdiL (CAAX protease family)
VCIIAANVGFLICCSLVQMLLCIVEADFLLPYCFGSLYLLTFCAVLTGLVLICCSLLVRCFILELFFMVADSWFPVEVQL